jgi:hypothetical protein
MGRMIGVQFPEGAVREFFLCHRVQTGSGAHPASYPTGSYPGINRPRREADHPPPSSAEVKNECSYASTPPVRLHGVVLVNGYVFKASYLVKRREDFTFTLLGIHVYSI